MKKAKVLLTAITVLAVVGGAFAFKAKHNTITLYNVCNTSVPVFTCASGAKDFDNATTAASGTAVDHAPLGQPCPNGDTDCTTFTTLDL